MFLTRPSPVGGFLDFYVFGEAFKKMNNFGSRDFLLRDKLGGGNFGTAYEALLIKGNETAGGRSSELTTEQKKRRVVLKKVNMDKTPER